MTKDKALAEIAAASEEKRPANFQFANLPRADLEGAIIAPGWIATEQKKGQK